MRGPTAVNRLEPWSGPILEIVYPVSGLSNVTRSSTPSSRDTSGGMTPSWPRSVPAYRLAGDPRDHAEVAVVVQQGQAVQFRRRGHHQVHPAPAPVLALRGQLAQYAPRSGLRPFPPPPPAEHR